MFDFDDLRISPQLFARLCNSSMNKLAKGQVDDGVVQRAFSIVQDIDTFFLGDPETWLTSPYVVEERAVIPWKVLCLGSSVEQFITDPVSVLDNLIPQWRLLFKKEVV